MEEINRKLLKMEEMVLRSAFLQPPAGALLIPSGSPPPWLKRCRAGGSSDALFAHSMKPPVIPVRSGNFIYSCVTDTSVCFSSEPAFVRCHLRSRLSRADTPADCGVPSLLRVAQALLPQEGPPARTWGSVLIRALPSWIIPSSPFWPRCSLSPTLSRAVFLPPAPTLPTLGRTHRSWALRPSSRPFLLPPVIRCSFWGWLLSPCLIGEHLPVCRESAQDHLLCEAFLGYTTSPSSGKHSPSVSSASWRSSLQGPLRPVVFPPTVMPSD